MAHIVLMPRQGNTVESCIIVGWKIQEGENVEPDTPLCDVETDKATFEVPAGATGTVLKRLWNEGDDVPVLKPIAVIGMAGEDWEKEVAGALQEVAGLDAPAPSGGEPPAPLAPPAPSAPVAVPPERGRPAAASPRARNLGARKGVSLAALTGTGPDGRVIERDVVAALAKAPALTSAALAAAQAGAPIPAAGSGIGGRITAADMTAPPEPAGPGAPEKPAALPEDRFTDTPIKGIRKVISDRMAASLAQSAQLTLTGDAPAERLQTLREHAKAAGDRLGLPALSINDLILFAVSRTLPAFPFMNAHKNGDTIRTFERVHLGVAVDTERGLMVPVIRNADTLRLRDIATEARRLAEACRKGTVTPDELRGSTFTVTNLGAFGITGFTPVLNAPEVAILGVCGITLKPRFAGNAGNAGNADRCVVFEPRIGFSLTINHQVVDGAPAARFLSALGSAAANIDALLI